MSSSVPVTPEKRATNSRSHPRFREKRLVIGWKASEDLARGCRILEQPLTCLMSLEKTVPHPLAGSPGMAQTTAFEEIIEVYLRDVDRTLIRENLALTPGQRLQKLEEFVEFLQSAKKSHCFTSEIDTDAKPI
jgi:hypothetical protein